MNIKKLNISYDTVTSKIMFDIDVDGVTCHGSVDVRKSEDLTDLLYAIEEGCQKIRRKIGTKDAETQAMTSAGVKSAKVPVMPGRTYKGKDGSVFRCDRITDMGIYFVNVDTGWRFMTHGLVMHDDKTISWDYSTNGRFVQ